MGAAHECVVAKWRALLLLKRATKMQSRREFIAKTLINSSAAAALPIVTRFSTASASVERKDAVDPHFIVYVQVYGAWDVCLAFDPKDRESKLSNGIVAFDQPYSMNEVQSYGAIRLAPQGAPLGKFADRMAIVNGIDMELDNGHTPVISMTGSPQGGSGVKPSIQALISENHRYIRKCLIPHLYASYDGFFVSGSLGARTVVISKLDAHRVIFSSGSPDALDNVGQSTIQFANSLPRTAQQKLGQYAKALSSGAELRRMIIRGNSGRVDPPDNAKHFGQFAGALFRNGITGSITWSLGEAYNFDTHSDHYTGHPLKMAIVDVADFCSELSAMPFDEHSSVLDHTTVVMTGEYCRTARLNGSQGKDHNIHSNSVMFLGRNVKPGVFGSSGEFGGVNGSGIEAHAAQPVDLASGFYSASGEVLHMRNIWAGSGSIFGTSLSGEFGQGTRAVGFLGI